MTGVGFHGARRILPWAALALYASGCLVFWVESEWRPEWDSALYLLTGQALAEGNGYTYLGEPFTLRPPGFPWLLSLLLRDGRYDYHAIHVILMLCAIATVAAVYILLRPLHGTWISLSVALLTGTSPLFVGNFNWILTEFPFTTLLFLSLALLQRSIGRDDRWWLPASVGALALAGAVYIRTIGLIVLPGILLSNMIHRAGRSRLRAALPVVTVVVLMLPWWRYSHENVSDDPPDQLLLHSYTTSILRVDPHDPDSRFVNPGEWMHRIVTNGQALARDVASATFHMDGVVPRTAAVALCLIGWILSARRQASILEWTGLAYVGVVLINFTYYERLLMPLTPMIYLYLLIAVAAGTRRLAARLARPDLAGAMTGAIITAVLLANAASLPRALAAEEWSTAAWPTLGQRWADLRTVAAWLRENTPEDSVILCYDATSIALLSGRRAYTFRFPDEREPFRTYDADYAVLDVQSPGIRQQVEQRTAEYWLIPSQIPGTVIPVVKLRKP